MIQEVPFLGVDLRLLKVQMQKHLCQPRAALFTHADSQVPISRGLGSGQVLRRKEALMWPGPEKP